MWALPSYWENYKMKDKEEIKIMLDYLEAERERAISNNAIGLALAIASQIELLKWILEK